MYFLPNTCYYIVIMSIDRSHPEHHNHLTIYREAISLPLAFGLTDAAYQLVALSGIDLTAESSRRFRTSKTVPTEELEGMLAILKGFPEIDLTQNSARVNLQFPLGRQGWHQDYVPEPLVAYPQGEGFLDVAPEARTIEEARRASEEGKMVSIPVQAGDIALVHDGGKIFHRGRNASSTDSRVTIVLH